MMPQENPVIVITEVLKKLEEHQFDPETLHESESEVTQMAIDEAGDRLTPYDIKLVVKMFFDLHEKFQSYFLARKYERT